jgi:hypothetical protein
MKKIVCFLFIFSFFIQSQSIKAQAFQKGNKNLDVGLGFGAYKTVSEFTTPEFVFLGFTIPPQTFKNEDGAASFMMPITFEYGISNKVGLGVQLGFSNYFIDNEDSTETTESVKSVDFAIVCNYHLSNSDKNDLFIGIALGGSNVNWKDLSGTELTGSGSVFKLYLSDRLYFSDHIGMLFNIGYTAYNYSDLTSSDNNAFISSLKWHLGGLNIGTGLAVKF